jgi:MFS family permease
MFWFIAMLVATGSLSQFFRTSNAVIAPELIRDLTLSSQMLGFANGVFFLALMLAQVPVGLLFDRIGVRRTVTILAIPMVAGAALHALAESGAMLVAARFLVGLGCAGSFMSVVVLVPRWFARDRWSTTLGLVFGTSQIGVLFAGPPLAFAAETIGWRQSFLWSALLAAIVGLGYYAFVKDHPEGKRVVPPVETADLGALAGVLAILRLPGMLKLFALFGVAYPTMVTITGLWAGPYLKDVHGLEPVARGQVLAAMAIGMVAGNFLIGPLDRLFRNTKWLVVGSAAATILIFAMMALLAKPPLWLAATLLILMGVTASYGPLLLTQIRSRVPDHLAGRGSTTANIAQLAGSALLPILSGWIPPLFPVAAGVAGYAPEAYRVMFALLALVLAVGLCVYARLDESRT